MWLFFALLAPLFWAIVHVMDSHCVNNIFEKPWMGVVTSALATSVVFLIVPFIVPAYDWSLMPKEMLFLAFFSGILIQISQAFYFKALSYSEAGIIAAYWNMIPALLPLASFILLMEVFEVHQYIGIGMLVTTSVIMCLIDTRLKTRWRAFFLMLGGSLFQVASYLIEDTVFDYIPFAAGFLFITLGIFVTGLLPLLVKRGRHRIISNFSKLRPMLGLFVAIETSNLVALASAQQAIALGNPSFVAAAETTVPAYTFMIAIVLGYTFPKLNDPKAMHRILIKLLMVVLMVIGVILIA